MKRALLALALTALTACQSIPADRYGIARLRFEGMEEMDAAALSACLASHERPVTGMLLGLRPDPTCESPPFDSHGPRVRLFAWPWTPWPLFDRVLWQKDLDRILRWYRARGFPDARVVETRITPRSAARRDIVTDQTECERDGEGEGCRVRITVVIDEGEPVLVRSVDVTTPDGFDARRRRALEGSVGLEVGARFDEHSHESTKAAMRDQLHEAGYCRARVEGSVRIHRADKWAEIAYDVEPGPICEIGRITVRGYGDLPSEVIVEAAYLETGARFRPSDLREAQRAILALGAFSAVDIRPEIPKEGAVVPLTIEVSPIERHRLLFGGGIQSGLGETTFDMENSVSSQWDIHLLGRWEARRILNGMRRLTIEERPRLIFNDEFPRIEAFQARNNLGNRLSAEFEQAGFLEARTSLLVAGTFDYGPDPFAAFVRHAIRAGTDVRRAFFDRKLRLSAGIHFAAYLIPGKTRPEPDDFAQDWLASFFQQTAELDLRDSPLKTTRGIYLSMRMQQTGYGLPSDYRYLRLLPDLRAYVPLPFGMVLAARGRLGMLVVKRELSGLTEDNPTRFGPDIHRLRGGGPNSNRGFLSQRLGDGEAGGTRLWEGSLELRAPISSNLWLAAFADVGDSHREPTFRWNYLQTSVGAGLRYYTLLGPIRLDVGFRIPSLQILGGGPDTRALDYCYDPEGARVDCDGENYRGTLFGGPPGAIHLTIGDAF